MSWFTANHIIVLALAGLGVVLFAIYFRNLARVHASGRWPAVQGKVAESWIEEDATTEEDGTVSRRYAPKVSYRYGVDQRAPSDGPSGRSHRLWTSHKQQPLQC